MRARSTFALIILTLGFAVAGCQSFQRVGSQRSTLLVVPGRYTVVQFALDMTYLRPVTVVAYTHTTNSPAPLIHVWRPGRREWTEVSADMISEGAIFRVKPAAMVLAGEEGELPASLANGCDWCGERYRVSALDIVSLVNTMDECCDFTGGEWKVLAKRYELKLKDRNALRRRYGRYGIPVSAALPPDRDENLKPVTLPPVDESTPTFLDPVETVDE